MLKLLLHHMLKEELYPKDMVNHCWIRLSIDGPVIYQSIVEAVQYLKTSPAVC